MATQGTFRNVNILSEITADNTEQAIDIYTPGFINPYDIVSGVKYSGFVTSLRMMVNINSTQELVLPESNPLDSREEQVDKQKDVIYSTPRKCLGIYLRNTTNRPILVGEILLFNRIPYYYVPLMRYLSDAATFDCGTDTVITVQMKDVGYGLLADNDHISIFGSSIEEAAYIEPAVLSVE